MEDAHIAMGSLSDGQGSWADTGLFGVFDGHGGEQVAKFCAKNLRDAITSGHACQAPSALRKSFMLVDEKLANASAIGDSWSPDFVGSTAVACLIRRDVITVANCGDSRAVMSRDGRAVNLSQDHKANLKAEAQRIRKAGGFTSQQNFGPHTIHRVNGDLALSRSIGDFRFKKNPRLNAEDQIVTCAPDVRTCKRQSEDEFMVIACDGVWDVLSSQDVVDRVHRELNAIRRGNVQPSEVVCKILDECLATDPVRNFGIGADNMTMMLIVFDDIGFAAPRTGLGKLAERLGCTAARNGPVAGPSDTADVAPTPALPMLLGSTRQMHGNDEKKRHRFARLTSKGTFEL